MANLQRNENETFQDYRERQNLFEKATKKLTEGKLVWDSRSKGTYVKAKHGDLE